MVSPINVGGTRRWIKSNPPRSSHKLDLSCFFAGNLAFLNRYVHPEHKMASASRSGERPCQLGDGEHMRSAAQNWPAALGPVEGVRQLDENGAVTTLPA